MGDLKDVPKEVCKVILQWFCGLFMCATPFALWGVVDTLLERPTKTETFFPLIIFMIGYTIIVFFISTSIADKERLKEHQRLVDVMAKRDAEKMKLIDDQKKLKDKVSHLEYELRKSKPKN